MITSASALERQRSSTAPGGSSTTGPRVAKGGCGAEPADEGRKHPKTRRSFGLRMRRTSSALSATRRPAMRFVASLSILLCVALTHPVNAAAQSTQTWVVSWIGSVQGPYPVGNPSAQPDMKLAFPSADTGARDQSFRMIVKPEIWAREARLRLANALGTKPVTLDGVFVGLHLASSAVVPGTNRRVTFRGKSSVTVPPGESA